MEQEYTIDTGWFREQLKKRGSNQSDLARFLGRDRSAVSRMLSGEKNMSVQQQDKIAEFLGVSLAEVAEHRFLPQSGFEEGKQGSYATHEAEPQQEASGKKAGKDPYRHPIFGCMKGTLTIAPGVDLTEPLDFEWSGKLYNE
ncbi:MAG: helix-turn-helix transcriptional regulator [Shinella sp.]|uniref:helix-turn-helix domain-containing protein n=1 Tax=Shinella sp. TaxID=1870904 RepID=UPI003C77B480